MLQIDLEHVDVELEECDCSVLVKVYSEEDASVEVEEAREKAHLFERVFNVMTGN